MKKHLVLAAAAFFAGSMAMSAQMQVLKDAERAQKGGEAPAKVVEIITPAFTNSETANLAQTYYIPGKAMFGEFDKLFGLKSLGRLGDGDAKKMADDLMQGYDFYMKALPLDTVVDAKGKVKTKYSKDIINTIAGHVSDYNDAAITYWDVKDYKGAYNAWKVFLDIYEVEPFKSKNTPLQDTVLAEVYFNQALAAWQADSLRNALNSFEKAHAKGYNKKTLYDYALSVSTGLKDNDAMFKWAQLGNEIYGKEDPNYLGYMINVYLQQKEYDKAFTTIDAAIASDPNNSQYYFVKGVLYDNMDKKADAKAMFAKAIELNDSNVQALTQYGAALCQEAYALSDQAPTSAAESQAYFDQKIKPLFEEAATYLEKAWQLDNENMDALRYLENIYYNLRDEQKQNEIKQRML
ncbi:MAG: hypothetical protein K1V80_03650 [Muribaculaceae bacterium]